MAYTRSPYMDIMMCNVNVNVEFRLNMYDGTYVNQMFDFETKIDCRLNECVRGAYCESAREHVCMLKKSNKSALSAETMGGKFLLITV